MIETGSGEDPRIVHRECGGFLALSGPRDDLRLGVTASSEEEARERFAAARSRWREILAGNA